MRDSLEHRLPVGVTNSISTRAPSLEFSVSNFDNFKWKISHLSIGNFLIFQSEIFNFQLRDCNFDTGTVAGTFEGRTCVYFHFAIARFAGTFMLQFRDLNCDTGTVAGIVSLQFRELNRTGAGILIFRRCILPSVPLSAALPQWWRVWWSTACCVCDITVTDFPNASTCSASSS